MTQYICTVSLLAQFVPATSTLVLLMSIFCKRICLEQSTYLRYLWFALASQTKSLSCRIFDSFGIPALRDQSFCSNHPSPIWTTWSQSQDHCLGSLSLNNLGSGKPRSTILLMSTSKHHLVPKCIYVLQRYLESGKAKLLCDPRQL